jgi:hypothetical protein
LTELDTQDQAASYWTIVLYKSEALQDFSFCVFQKHNVYQCQATISVNTLSDSHGQMERTRIDTRCRTKLVSWTFGWQ